MTESTQPGQEPSKRSIRAFAIPLPTDLRKEEAVMSKWSIAVPLMILIACVVAPADALDPGEVGSVECRLAQLDVFDLVAERGPFKNHGQLMKTINRLLNDRIRGGVISGRCAACIRKQFARKIPTRGAGAVR